MIAKAAAGIVLGIVVAAMILVGVCFAGFAIFSALETPVGVAGAAALTALILLIGPVLFVFIAALFRPRRRDFASDAFLANLFGGIVRDRPLMAMLGAGLLGAAGIFLRRKR
jgi:LPXTG-motif cell wall-anchored protein